jgi:predicted ABC-type ATPase
VNNPFDARPLIVAIAGPNGAGKSTFYQAYLRPAGLRHVNADDLARELGVGAYDAAATAERIRHALLAMSESFVFETVFSDPGGEKVEFLKAAVARGYSVVVCFIGLDRVETSDQRVAMRVLQGGHDVPYEKLEARYPRSLTNLRRAIETLPRVLVYDNSDLSQPFRRAADFERGVLVQHWMPLPAWLPAYPFPAP